MLKFFFPILLFSIALLFFVIGLKFLYDIYKFKKTAIKAIATVVDVKNSTGKNNVKTYSPVLSFKTIDGADYIYDVSRYYPIQYTVGEKIEVVYPKENPKRVMINSAAHTFMTPAVLIVLGLVGIGISIWLFFKK